MAGPEGVIASVTFAGMLEGTRKEAAFAAAEIFVLPSYSENFGTRYRRSIGSRPSGDHFEQSKHL